jgi:CDP-diacylglycerol--glycerol-3-phosphate 3-phosphatidyltransferase
LEASSLFGCADSIAGMNLPNQLTVLRLLLTFPFVAALSIDFPGSKALALVIFVLASVTDFADGYIARRFNLITDFGKLMDPLVDKIMTMAAFICLVSLGSISAWAVIVIVSREFMITGLRLVAVAKGKVLPAERLGKHKTIWQIITIIYLLALTAFREPLGNPPPTVLALTGSFLVYVTVALTVISGISYFGRNWDLVREM